MVFWFVAIAVAGRAAHQRRSGRAAAINPYYAHRFHARARQDRADHARRGVPGRHRQRGALCRSRPLRPQADPDGVVLPGAAGAAAQLFRSGRAGARQPGSDRKSVLSAGSRSAAAADDRAGDRGDRDRQPGGDHRRLFAHPPGDPARLVAAAGNPAHLGLAVRTDLHSARQLRCCSSACCCWSDCSGPRAIWRRAYGIAVADHDGGRRLAGLHRHLEAVEVEVLAGGAAGGAVRSSSMWRSLSPAC